MSISYSFTDRNSIRIECGDEWIEISLPQALDQDEPTPSPEAAPEPARAPSEPERGRRPGRIKPPHFPGVMLVVGNKMPEDDEDYLGTETPEFLIDLADIDMKHIENALKRIKSIGHWRTLDVSFDPSSPIDTSALDDLNQLMRDPSIDLDAVRLWTK
jgi:hypothetical protein